MKTLNDFKIVELQDVNSSLRISGGQNDDDCVGTTTGGCDEGDTCSPNGDWEDEGCCEVAPGGGTKGSAY